MTPPELEGREVEDAGSEGGEREERDAVGWVGREELEERGVHGEGFLNRMSKGREEITSNALERDNSR